MKFRCKCGQVVSDTTDDLPYKAYFLPDEEINYALNNVMEKVAAFIEARERGEQEQYLKEQAIFLREPTLKNLLYHHFSPPTFEFGRTMYECDECGRMWMKTHWDRGELVSYHPESASRGILSHQGATPDA